MKELLNISINFKIGDVVQPSEDPILVRIDNMDQVGVFHFTGSLDSILYPQSAPILDPYVKNIPKKYAWPDWNMYPFNLYDKDPNRHTIDFDKDTGIATVYMFVTERATDVDPPRNMDSSGRRDARITTRKVWRRSHQMPLIAAELTEEIEPTVVFPKEIFRGTIVKFPKHLNMECTDELITFLIENEGTDNTSDLLIKTREKFRGLSARVYTDDGLYLELPLTKLEKCL